MDQKCFNSQRTNVSKIPSIPEPEDIFSIRGLYGWQQIGEFKIPYLMRFVNRCSVIYVCAQMAETYLLKNYLPYVDQMLTKITCVMGHLITESEAKLLNTINERTGYIYGNDQNQFQGGKDYIVRLEDVKEFHFFMESFYCQLMRNEHTLRQTKCGYILINSQSVAPYCIRDNKKYIPVMYFGNDKKFFEMKTIKLKLWDLMYLKFCTNILGIENEEFYNSDCCDVISFGDMIKYFPRKSTFKEYWPISGVTELPHDKKPKYLNAWFKRSDNIVPESSPAPTTIESPQ